MVIDALKLVRPILVGHSIAGEELSSVGSRHPERIAGLIYLDAAYSYAFYDTSHGDLDIDLNELRGQIDSLQSGSGNQSQLMQQLLHTTIPAFEKDLKQRQDEQAKRPRLPNPPPPAAADLANFDAYRAYQKRVLGWPRTEANLRGQFELTPDGHLGKSRLTADLHQALMAGEQKYTNVRVPVLAIFASPSDPGPYADGDSLALAAFEAYDSRLAEAQARAVRAAAPSARVVFLGACKSRHLYVQRCGCPAGNARLFNKFALVTILTSTDGQVPFLSSRSQLARRPFHRWDEKARYR